MAQHGGWDWRGSRTRLLTSVVGVLAGFLIVGGLVALGLQLAGAAQGMAGRVEVASPTATGSGTSSTVTAIPVPSLSAAQLATLPQSTTETSVKQAPVDLQSASEGRVINIAEDTAGFARPGAEAITVIPSRQIGGDTWLPVVARKANWLQVRLPSRPNGATAWIADTGQRTATTRWAVDIRLESGTMSIERDGKQVDSWPIGQGRSATPTPVGQTFLLAGFVDPQQTFSPVIYALGAHSETLDTYGGGPGTVAVHGWPTQAGRTGQVSHGCVRVPAAALDSFAKLPAGTPVSIST